MKSQSSVADVELIKLFMSNFLGRWWPGEEEVTELLEAEMVRKSVT